jgi:hypothetical protein
MELKTTLDMELTRRYEAVKEHTHMLNDKSVLGFLISKEYNRIQRAKRHKVFLPKKTYDLAEKAAKARGQTIDEYVEELTEEMIKNAEEAEKHGNR